MKYVTPALNLLAFNCPVCHVLAPQEWHNARADAIGSKELPEVIGDSWFSRIYDNIEGEDADPRGLVRESFSKKQNSIASNSIIAWGDSSSSYTTPITNLFFSICGHCGEVSVWICDRLLHPAASIDILPNEDMPATARGDFEEARRIADLSPRGAAALLRLCIDNITKALHAEGKTLDDRIGSLVAKGLPQMVKHSLDAVRVVGNNAVHPGELDIKDDRRTVGLLFEVINIICDQLITQPKKISGLYEKLPQGALAAIEKRDEKKINDKEKDQ